jgi:rSAM-associated Gly-rich repeat protein
MKIQHYLLQILAAFSVTVLSSYSTKVLSAESKSISEQSIEARLTAVREKLQEMSEQSPPNLMNSGNANIKIAQWPNYWSNWGNWGNARRWYNY